MGSEKVKEIKKALECCSVMSNNCDKCPFFKEGFDCGPYLMIHTLKLINELESENDTLHTNLCEWRKENQQLKDRIAELEEGIAQSMLGCEFLPECTDEILKQFSERLKIECVNKIHETLKEFTKN